MITHHLNQLLLLTVIFSATQTSASVQGARDFSKKVSIMLKEDPKTPKCFAEGRKDFTCFWEEDEERAESLDQYSFKYTYQNENSSRCPLRSIPAAHGKRLFICHLNQPKMFVQMDMQVHRKGMLIYNRSLLVEMVFLLDPPANVTVTSTTKQGQLNVTWVPPPLKYMDDSMVYEVSYSTVDSHMWQVEMVQASSELILRGLQPGTKYKVRVRVKLDGISYSGYWSAWSESVLIETLPAELDPLILSLVLIIFFVLIGLFFTTLMSHRRYLVKKIWPKIPTPDSKFHGLFTIYGGEFQLWLEQTIGLWVIPVFFNSEELSSSLEVLSELYNCPSRSSQLLTKDTNFLATHNCVMNSMVERENCEGAHSTLPEDWKTTTNNEMPMDSWRAAQHNAVPCSKSSFMEAQDAYVTLSTNNHREEENLDNILEETLPLETNFASRKQICESHSDLGSMQQSSGLSHLSSQSSFEYPNYAWMSKVYTYMAAVDSGVSVDYSPMHRVDAIGKMIHTNEYKNGIDAQKRPFLVKTNPVHDES
ncbi:erythropoietin receptor [Takifugu rubripes]|uniref:Erythropoietin receptor n=1 Tax=Takifugu rubripes TaxID=31033 RepID=A0A3B5KN53_TAKRU|nr:erythropoietin receptor-like [Takifugu rubripes]|eukprot:XP_003966434.1 PREDICTED: erythropoietin receptor-like [Takifugu rubripes]